MKISYNFANKMAEEMSKSLASQGDFSQDIFGSNEYLLISTFRKNFINVNSKKVLGRTFYIVLYQDVFIEGILSRNKNSFDSISLPQLDPTSNYAVLRSDFSIADQGRIDNSISQFLRRFPHANILCIEDVRIYAYINAQKVPINILYEESTAEEFESMHTIGKLEEFLENAYPLFISELRQEICLPNELINKIDASKDKEIVAITKVNQVSMNHLVKYMEKYIGGTYEIRSTDSFEYIYVEIGEQPYFFSTEYLGCIISEAQQSIQEYANESIIKVNIRKAIIHMKQSEPKQIYYSLGYLILLDGRKQCTPCMPQTLNYCLEGFEEYRNRYRIIDKFKLAAC